MTDQPAAQPAHRDRSIWILAAAVALMLAIHFVPSPPALRHQEELIALSAEGKSCLAILAFAVVLWVTEAMPFAATSLSVLLLIPAFGLASFERVVGDGFGDPLITFFIGVLLLSAAFTRSGLGARFAYHLLLRLGTRTDRVLLGFLTVGALVSMWITDIAVAAMLLPLGQGLLRDARLKPRESNFGRALMISCAFGPLIGGIATPAGTGANLLALGYLRDLANVDISFTRWMLYGVPASLLMVPAGWYVLLKVFPPELERLPFDRATIERGLQQLGPLRSSEWKTLAIFAATIAIWVATPLLDDLTNGAINPPIEAVGLLAGVALFLPGVRILSWKQAQADLDWGGIVLIVAGLSLGLLVYETGAARWLAVVLMSDLAVAPFALRPFLIVIAVSVLHLLFSSNTVTGTIIIPILIALAQDFGLDPWITAGPAAFTSSLAFILVTESPTNVIPYAAGYFSIKDMAKAGIWMTLLGAVCVTVSVLLVDALRAAW